MLDTNNCDQEMVSSIFTFDILQHFNLKDGFVLKFQGSEAKIYEGLFMGKPSILKERFVKKYRHPDLDKSLTSERMKAEVRSLNKCREMGISCPAVYFADLNSRCIILQQIVDCITVKDYLLSYNHEQKLSALAPLAFKIGEGIGKLHAKSIVHGDLTTSNMLLKKSDLQNIVSDSPFDVFFIDFGLSKRDAIIEDCAVDLYVLERAISSSHLNSEEFFETILKYYHQVFSRISSTEDTSEVATKLEEVRQRGRKRTMVG